jgi:hypothetical protein
MALRWGSCTGYSNRNYACDQGSGSDLLVASFSPPGGVGNMTGVSAIIRFTADGALPAWWDVVNRGGCRASSLSSSFDVSDQTECDDPWQGQAMGGIAYFRPDGQGAVLEIAVAVAFSASQSASSGPYAAFKIYVNHQRSSGPGSCAGCSTPVCITLEGMTVASATTGEPNVPGKTCDITTGIMGMGGASNVVTWQGGTPSCGAGAPKPSTWTEVKRRFGH